MRHALRVTVLSAVWVLAVVPVATTSAATGMKGVFPGKTWERLAPAEAGMDEETLREVARYLGGRGCVARYGRMVYTWGDWDRRGDVASAAKPWYSTLLFQAVEDDLLSSLDARVAEFVPELNEINAALGHKDAAITFRHLANQTSCYGMVEAPGTAYDYNDWQMALFVDTLIQKVYGSTLEQVDDAVFHPRLTDVIGCEDQPTMLAFGLQNRPGRVSVSPRDFARLGLLYLKDGLWEGKQVLSVEHVRQALRSPVPNAIPRAGSKAAEMIKGQRSIGSRSIPDNQTDHYGSYSWLWWINGVDRDGNRRWPHAPSDTFTALGHRNGMRGMAVLPGPEIIMAWNDTTLDKHPEEPHPLDPALRLLMESATDAPMIGQVTVHPDNPRHLVRLTADGQGAPLFLCGPGDPEDFLYRGERQPDGKRQGDQDAILDRMKGTGANCLYVQAIRSHGGDGDKTHNPFIDSNPEKGLDEDILNQWDGWLTRMDEEGIIVLFFIYDDSARLWNTGDQVSPPEETFIETLVDRLEHHRNLIWCIAEEYEEALSPKRVQRLAALIRRSDEHNHAIAVHKLNGLDFSELADDPNVDQFAVQYNEATADALHGGMVQAWTEARGRYGVNLSEAADHGFGIEAVRKHWAAVMAGTCGVMALNWTFDARDAPSRDDLLACGRLVRFVESTDFQDMAPADDLRRGDTKHVLARPGRSYILYTDGGAAPLGVHGAPSGAYILKWHQVDTGREVVQGPIKASTNRDFPRPEGMTGAVAVWIQKADQ